MNFKDMTTNAKMIVLVVVSVLSVIVLSVFGTHSLYQSGETMNKMYGERLVPVEVVSTIKANAITGNLLAMQMMVEPDDYKTAVIKNNLEKIGDSTDEMYSKLSEMEIDSTSKKLTDEILSDRDRYKEAREPVLALASVGKNAEAYALYVKDVEPLADKYINDCNALTDYYVNAADDMNIINLQDNRQVSWMMVGISLIIALLVALIGYTISKSITVPIKNMIAVCQEFANGDFRDKPRKYVSKNDIGYLADALANMRTELRQLFAKVIDSSEQVAASSEQLTATSEQSALAITQIAESITDVAASASVQMEAVNVSTDTVTKLATDINDASSRAVKVTNATKTTSDAVNTGNVSIKKVIEQMGYIEKTVADSSVVVSGLANKSKEIGVIVETIRGIADQTNLLALNAAIEAARAGEHGKGFTVVAEEVRKLAEQSKLASEQVSDLISGVQSETDRAVDSMHSGSEAIKIGTEVVSVAGASFDKIDESVNDIQEQIQVIVSLIDNMSKRSESIVSAAEAVENHSKKTMGETQTISAASEQQSASMEEIASSSHSLAILAQDMQNAVQKFQI